MPAISLTEEMRRVAASHLRTGEPCTADLLFRAVAHISELEDGMKKKQKRIERLVESR
jgi:hypothetical protein